MEDMRDHPYRIFHWYKEQGYVEVAGYYSGDNHCKLCGWENTNTAKVRCRGGCADKYAQDASDGVFPMGLENLSFEDWIVFQAIQFQINHGQKPFAVAEEYKEEIKTIRPRYYQAHSQEAHSTNHRENNPLYQHK